jgi:DHA3 family tetracycline resistance protein-like MFS transporter
MFLLMRAGFAFSAALYLAASTIYQVQTAGLTPLQLVLVGTVFEVAIFLFEVPTGVIADSYSRRLSIVIGYALLGLGFLVEGTFAALWPILVAQVIMGIGESFTSGATEAWISDEVGEEAAGRLFLRAARLANIAAIAGTLLGILLGSLAITAPIIFAALIFLALSGFLALFMPESGFQPVSREHRWRQMGSTLRGGLNLLRVRPVLLTLVGISLFFGLNSEGYDRLNEAHLLTSFALPSLVGLQPVAWINLLNLAGQLLTALALHRVERRLDMSNGAALAKVTFLLTGLLMASLVGFALAGSLWLAIVLRWVVVVLRSVADPIQLAWVNQHTPSQVRATVLSMRGQVNSLGETLGGPPVGLIGERWGISTALVASSLLLAPVLYLCGRLYREPDVEGVVDSPM